MTNSSRNTSVIYLVRLIGLENFWVTYENTNLKRKMNLNLFVPIYNAISKLFSDTV
jgi:hypothetical protein